MYKNLESVIYPIYSIQITTVKTIQLMNLHQAWAACDEINFRWPYASSKALAP